MHFNLTLQLLSRCFLWLLVMSADKVGVKILKYAPDNEGFYFAVFAITLVIFLIVLMMGTSNLLRDMQEICLYDVFLQLLGLRLYLAGYSSDIYLVLTDTLFFMKFGRLVWPCRTDNLASLVRWPLFGFWGYFRQPSKDEGQESAPSKKQAIFAYLYIGFAVVLSFKPFPFNPNYFHVIPVLVMLRYYTPILTWLKAQHQETLAETARAQEEQAAKIKLAEQLAHHEAERNAKLARLNDSLRDAAHDLRAPMATIQLRTSALLRAQTKPSQAGYALEKAVADFGKALDETIHDAMVATGLIAPNIVAVDIDQVLAKIHNRWADAAIEKEFADMNLYPASGSGLKVAADLRIIHRILDNLVSNAIAHGGRGCCMALSARQHGAFCVVRVWDTGRGMELADGPDRSENFTALVQRLRQQHQPGHGLGVNIVANLCEIMGIDMQLRSRLGRGSVFRFSLPLADASLIATTKQQQEQQKALLADMLLAN